MARRGSGVVFRLFALFHGQALRIAHDVNDWLDRHPDDKILRTQLAVGNDNKSPVQDHIYLTIWYETKIDA